tara:strand:- start:1394 stop:1846 length:453 start_codon:yes stop_codon:yes gene_type:complete
MRALLRRVSRASVEVENRLVGSIEVGILVYLGIHEADSSNDIEWLINKILGIRIFEDDTGKMNLSLGKDNGVLVVSQFTLFGNLKKGSRPSFHRAAKPQVARKIYDEFIASFSKTYSGKVECGEFGMEMYISATDIGPVTIWLDSQSKDY